MTNKFLNLLNAILADPEKRHAARYKLVRQIAGLFGFRVYARDLAWVNDRDYKNSWQDFPGNSGTKNYVDDRRFQLYTLAKSVKHIPGDLAECGVRFGASSFILLAATEKTDKHLYGFDSFKGLSEPEQEDAVNEDYLYKWKKDDLAISDSAALKNLAQFGERVTLFKGWIPSRFSEVEDKPFCLVNIDVDLYSPTKDSLEFFYEKLNPGGVIVCDDYGAEICPGAKKAMDDFAHSIEKSVMHLTTGQGLLFKD